MAEKSACRIVPAEPLKLHIGCGRIRIPDFVHIDVLNFAHVDICHKVDDLPLPDEAASLIYASHVLEHFGRFEVEGVLREWLRVLTKGGVLRLAVPDFGAVVAMYSTEGLRDGLSGLMGLVCGGQRGPYDFHKIIFDEPFLTYLLRKVGFSEVRRWDWRATDHAHIDDFSQAYLPHMDKENGRLMSLNLEAVK